MTRVGDWMQTAHGHQFWPLDPRADEIDIYDIAHALSLSCRFGGHCWRFYSVAEHSVHVARSAPPDQRLAALLHDASEAYLSDVIRPVKRFLSNYGEIEARLERCIAEKFGLVWPWSVEIKRLDNAMLAAERDQVMLTPPVDWRLEEAPLPCRVEFWEPERAEDEFMAMFDALTP